MKTNPAEIAINEVLGMLTGSDTPMPEPFSSGPNPEVAQKFVPEPPKPVAPKPTPPPAARSVVVSDPVPPASVADAISAAAAEASVGPAKLFFTGRLASGKDFAAAAANCTIISFAEPLYAIASAYFGVPVSASAGKNLPGVRGFLQFAGQIGRGVVSEQYPLNATRALLIQRVRSDGAAGLFSHSEVAWETFGDNNDIWLDAAVARAAALDAHRIAFTNVRFYNEFERLKSEGYTHWHCMCSVKTWTARLAKQNLTPASPVLKDESEAFATKLDASVIKTCSQQKTGPKLRAIWSDSEPAPSPRLHSIASFLKTLN